jgi:flagellar hook-associated protein 2
VAISFGSINTGLPPNIVQQLVEAERQPLKAIELRKGKAQEQLKLVEDLTGKVREIFTGLRELGNTRGFADVKIESGDPTIVQGTVDKNSATTGSYMVEVMKLAHKTSAASNGYPDKDQTQVGVGYFKVTDANGKSREVYVDKTNNTLEKLAKLINSKGLGINASVIQDKSDKENPYRLMLSGKGIGEDGGVEFPTFYFLDGDQDFYLDKQRPAENGRVKIDGFEFEINDNKLADIIPGVTLDLKQAAPGREINVSVGEDREVILGKVKKFVEQVNGVLGFVQSQNKLNEKSDTTKTLGGDAMLRQVENRLRDTLQNPVYGIKGEVKYLSQVGISFNRNGLLDFDEEKFNTAVAKQLHDVTEFFMGDNQSTGLVPRVKNALNTFLDSATGPLVQRARGIRSKIDQFDNQIANKERILAQKETQLKSQFARLEETMARLKSQGAFLQARMGGGGGDGGFNLNQTG